MVEKYLECLSWILSYYHRGCVSWTWFYPYLYAPLGSDLRNLASYNITFDEGRPFTPLLQLLSVLPPQSSAFLPNSYGHLTSPHSPLSLYFPQDFEVDANEKRTSWESLVQIPFMEQQLLIDTVNEIDHRALLTDKEKGRHRFGNEFVYDPEQNSSKQ